MSETSDVVHVLHEVIDIEEDGQDEVQETRRTNSSHPREQPVSHCVIIDDDDGVEVVVASKRKACADIAQSSKRVHLQIPDGDEAMDMDTCGCKVPFFKTRRDWLEALDAKKNGDVVCVAQPPLLVQLAKFTCPSCLLQVSCRDVASLLGPTHSKQAMKDLSCACLESLQDRNWMSHCPMMLQAAIQALVESPASSLSTGVWSPQMWQLRSLSLSQLRVIMRQLGLQAAGSFEECAARLLASGQGRALLSEAAKSVAMMALLYRGRLISLDQLPLSHFCNPATSNADACGNEAAGSSKHVGKSQRRFRHKESKQGISTHSGVAGSKPNTKLASHPLNSEPFTWDSSASLQTLSSAVPPPPGPNFSATPAKAPPPSGQQGAAAASNIRRSPRLSAPAGALPPPGSSSSGAQPNQSAKQQASKFEPFPAPSAPWTSMAHSLAAAGPIPTASSKASFEFAKAQFAKMDHMFDGFVPSLGGKPSGLPGVPFPLQGYPGPGNYSGYNYGYRSGRKVSNGTGYAGDSYHEMERAAPRMEAAKSRRENLQNELLKTMQAVQFMLQHCTHQGALKSEMLGAAAVALEGGLSALLRSTLLNDSLVDMSDHTALYQSVLGIVKACAASQTLLPVLTSPADWPVVDECPLESAEAGAPGPSGRGQPPQHGPAAALRSRAPKPAAGEGGEAKSGSVQDQLQQLQQICALYQRMLSQGVADNESDINVLALVLEITGTNDAVKEAVDTWNLVRESEGARGSSRDAAAMAGPSRRCAPALTVEQERHELEEKLGKLRLITCKLAHEHSYAHMAQNLAGGSRKRMQAIMQEVSSLATCLPVTWESSVHVAVDEDRIDLLRVLILPGQDTPYANGVFVFDAFLPANYPEGNPLVKFLTTGAGRVRFNPNLYQCGKVCLSLLGTWSGPSWQPGVSTFLQVLVSLQAMVFCQKPYFNEPGYQASEGTASGNQASDRYNAQVQRDNVQFGILAPLSKPQGKPHAVFAEVLDLHWRHKRQIIKDQLKAWGSPSAGEVSRLLDALR